MSGSDNSIAASFERMSRVWSDMLGAATGMGRTTDPAAPDKLRSAFMDSMTRFTEDFFRSSMFGEMAQKAMSHALAFQTHLGEFLGKTVSASLNPQRVWQDDIVAAVQASEERLLQRVEELQHRVESLEGRKRRRPSSSASKRKPARPKRRR
jgi:hypothetical protein